MWLNNEQMKKLNTGIGFLSTYSKAMAAKSAGDVNAVFGNIEASQLLRNAQMRMNQGVNQGKEEKRKGEILASNAVAQMAASGGGIDPVMLAKIKQRADYNTLAAVYNAKVDANAMKSQAEMAKIKSSYEQRIGNIKYADMLTGAFTTALTKWPKPGGNSNG